MKSQQEIEERLKKLEDNSILKKEIAIIEVNALLALMQLEIETKNRRIIMSEYSASFTFSKENDSPKHFLMYSNIAVEDFCSEEEHLYDMIDFHADFYWEDERIKSLPDGEYRCYVRGQAEFESDRDWETGIEEGHFLLGIEKITIEQIVSSKEEK
jgi:hypothetical protein